MIGRTLARYTIVSEIGSGGMGRVYLARDRELQRAVALKVLPEGVARDPLVLARFRQEARALAAVNHPGIVVIHSVEEVGGTHFLTMELVQGRTLDAVIRDDAPGWGCVLAIGAELAAALEAAHAQGVTHRDLKPANVMLTPDGHVKVLDFGLAKLVREEPPPDADPERTETMLTGGRVVGTPHYMAPEQVRGGAVDHRADIFALGAVLHHLATGRRPFRGETPAEVLASVLRDRPPPAASLRPDCPALLSRIIDRCLEKDPAERYQTASELHEDLAQAARAASSNHGPAHSIAVLPFVDMSPQGDQEHFCAGIAEEIINGLTRIEGLRVVSRLSSFQCRELGDDSRGIGRRLGVQYLLEGSVRKSGERLRIMAQLIDINDDCHLWSQRFDRELRDIFEVQDEIAQAIVKALRLAIVPDDAGHLVGARTRDPAAYDLYLRGRDFFRRWGKRNTLIAQRMFEQAVEADPDFASAWAGLADTYSYLYMYINSSRANLERADRHSAHALDLDPALAEAHAARGLALSLGKHHEAAAGAFGRAVELDPNLFEAYYFWARDCVVQGKYLEAVAFYAKAAAASPADYQIPILAAQVHHALGDRGREEEANRRGLKLAEKAILLNPEDARACYMGAGAMIRLGQRERGLKWARRALALDPDDPAILYNVACSYAGLGRVDEAIDCLERTVKVGAAYREWMLNDSDLDPLRGAARFQALVASLAPAAPAD